MAIILEKGKKINLTKKSPVLGKINVNLNWNQGNQSKGFFSSLFATNSAVDLDLGCLFELKNGKKGAVQALGNSFGNFTEEPFMYLDGDDRTGESQGGENIFINGDLIKNIKRILVYTFIYQGAANWSEVDGVVTIKRPLEEDIVIKMDEHRNGVNMCALIMLENMNDETFSVEKLVQYFHGHEEMDKQYNWGLKWVAGRK
jgi:tellurite resistance protein TerA